MQPPDDNRERIPAGEEAEPPLYTELPPSEPVFRKNILSYVTLIFLLVLWPGSSILGFGDPIKALQLMSLAPIYLVYIPTIVVQWLIFLLIFLTVYLEGTGLAGIGFRRLRLLDFFWAIAFLLVSNFLLSMISLGLKEIGLEIPGELALILPKTTPERIVWGILSITAGICEETAFRGYLITRLRLVSGIKGWVIPVILSSLVFGSGHSYQGVGGFLLISCYGAMFAVLFLYTKSLWPVIIAHFFQDFSALFFPFQR